MKKPKRQTYRTYRTYSKLIRAPQSEADAIGIFLLTMPSDLCTVGDAVVEWQPRLFGVFGDGEDAYVHSFVRKK